MPITLPPELEAWLQAHVANGDFSSVEEAARQLIKERIAERAAEEERRRKSRNREVLRVGDLSDADLEAIAATEMDSRHQHLDCEL
jgi:Arc/MetJ-type ribon-helix-helix transcriptional regulator